ncbi:MAG: hypothetical protein A2Y79_00470 [Deltaproteobacteria bacterium RBG_13_43_22]|nr:MAG: hypothetical protein A2Y79_00470 [Deltaproteobacteria bacterium RBG_13_43_22]
MNIKTQQRQLRLQNCLQTILEVHEFMGGQAIHLDIIHQLENLRALITHFQPEQLSEQDLKKIEESTNHLLRELAKIFHIKKLGMLYGGNYH